MKSKASFYLGFLSLPTLAKLMKVYKPSSIVPLKVNALDLLLITNEIGQVVRFKIGKMNEQGQLSGEEFRRDFSLDKEGKIIHVDIQFVGKCHD